MVLQIRFAIWLTLQIEVEALHICKRSHHFASTISAFHVRLRPPAPPPRAISLRPSVLPAACARPDGGGRSRTDANDDGDERRTRPGLGGDWREDLDWTATGGDLTWAATWHARRTSKWREGKKNARTRSVKKKSGVRSILWVCQV